jgi:Mn-dependent DtxR family transcriptional regulator
MTTLKIVVDDDRAGMLKNLLQEISFVKSVEEDHKVMENNRRVNETSLDRIKKILDKAKGKDLFKDIEDPSEWQRELRKEWDRDL